MPRHRIELNDNNISSNDEQSCSKRPLLAWKRSNSEEGQQGSDSYVNNKRVSRNENSMKSNRSGNIQKAQTLIRQLSEHEMNFRQQQDLADKNDEKKTNEWANSLLTELDNLMQSNKATTNVQLRSTPPPRTPTSPTQRSTIINVTLRKTTPSPKTSTSIEKNSNHSITTNNSNNDNSNFRKPEKHVSIWFYVFFLL